MIRFALLLLLFPAIASAGTPTPTRFKNEVFTDVTITKDLNYAPADNGGEHGFDLYQPSGDHLKGRPLIIWMHGGGFKFGSKSIHEAQVWCKLFAKRGYVCASIDYRTSKNKFSFKFEEMQKDTYYAVNDLRKAIAFFKQNYQQFNIDPDKIILAGNSAGGIMGLQAAYATDAELAAETGVKINQQVSVPSAGTEKVAAVVNFWGAIYKLEWLRNARIPIVSVTGSNDKIISPENGNGVMYGSIAIEKEATRLHIPNRLKVFKGYSHELQVLFNPFFADKGTEERWAKAAQFACDFLYDQLYAKGS